MAAKTCAVGPNRICLSAGSPLALSLVRSAGAPQHFLNFFPLPQGHRSFLPILLTASLRASMDYYPHLRSTRQPKVGGLRMALTFLSNDIWPRLRKLARSRGRAVVAVPFLGTGAANRLALRRGDVLVTKFD